MHTTENRDYIRIDEQIIRIDEEIIRKRERNRRRNIHTWPDVHWDYTKYPYTLKARVFNKRFFLTDLTDKFRGNCVTPLPTINTYHFNNESEFLCRVMKIYLDFSISATCTLKSFTEIEEIKEIK